MKKMHLPVYWLRANVLVVGLATAIAGITSTARAEVDPPERMTYQGFLVDGKGGALGYKEPTTYEVIFRIYKEQTGGDALWAERQTVTVSDGYFSVLLGEGAEDDNEPRGPLSEVFTGEDASERYIAITVRDIGEGGANLDIQPRLRLVTSPYSFLAKNAALAALARQAQALVSPNGDELVTAADGALTVNGRIQVGPVAASEVPKLIVFGGGDSFHVGKTGDDDTLELKGEKIKLTGDVTVNDKHLPVGEEKLRIVRGTVNGNGGIQHGSGFKINKTGIGMYQITFEPQFSDVPSVTCSTLGDSDTKDHKDIDDVAHVDRVDMSVLVVRTIDTDNRSPPSDRPQDSKFMFIAVGPR